MDFCKIFHALFLILEGVVGEEEIVCCFAFGFVFFFNCYRFCFQGITCMEKIPGGLEFCANFFST